MPNKAPQTRGFVKRDKDGQWFVISSAKESAESQTDAWIKSSVTYTVKA